MNFDDKMYTDGFIDQYQYIFMSLEQTVMDYRDEMPDLTDHHVDKVYEGLQRIYKKQSQGRKPPTLRLQPIEQRLFHKLSQSAEFYLGNLIDDDMTDEDKAFILQHTVDTVILEEVFKRLRKSIQLWNSSFGKYGYLDYIESFLND